MRDTTYLRLLADRMDPEFLVEILGLTSQEIVLMWADEFIARKEDLQHLVDVPEFRNE